MKTKRMVSMLCAALTAMGTAAAFPAEYAVSAEPVELFFDDFEDGDTDGWASHGGAATVSLSTEQAHTGSSSFYITDREKDWQGGECSKVGYFYAGQSYTVSIWFYYDDESSSDTQNFQLGYKYTENGATRYGSVGSVNANKGEWTQMTANVTFPSNITGITLYTQCSNATLPYYIDDCSGTGEKYEGDTQDGFSYDFEDGSVSDWFARSCDIAISSQLAHSGTYSLYTSNRTDLWNSPAVDCTLFLELGGYYSFSCWVAYDGGSYTDTAAFQIYLMYNLDGVTQYKNLADETTAKGEWVQISTRYTVPEKATNLAFYVQPKWSSNPSDQDKTISFYIDDVVCEHLPDPTIQSDIGSLCEAYADLFKIGCASTASELSLQASKDLILKHYNSLTFGNELKPDAVLSQSACIATGSETGVGISLTSAKPLLEFAAANNIPVRGHCLVWHSQTPDWFFRVGYSADGAWVDRDTMLKRMENYIKAVMEALAKDYPNVNFYCWDVVNEAFLDDGSYRPAGSTNEDSVNSPWIKTIGEDYISYAFTYARKYAPSGCKLFYNDYNEYASGKRSSIIKVVSALAEQNLIDGIGMQSHLQLSYPTVSVYEDTIRAYAALGLEVQITELDVSVKDNSNAAQLELAERYRQLMETVIACKKDGCNITAVVFWGITDSTSWIGGYPLLFDDDYQAKASFYAVLDPTAPVQTIQNKDAIAVSAGNSAETAFNVQAAASIGSAGTWKAVWNGSTLTVRLTAAKSGTAQILFGGETYSKAVSAGTNDLTFTLDSTKTGTAYSFDIALNGTTWNSLNNSLSEDTAGTITLAAFPAYAEATYGTPKIDGSAESIWDSAPQISVNQFQMGNANSNATGTAKMLWDENYLYVLVDVKDPNGTHSSSTNHYETDTVEVFFDENNHKTTAYENDDMQCRVGYDNSKTVSDNHSTDDYISAASTTSNGYLVEIAIPASIAKFQNDQVIGFDVQINDDDGSGARSGISNWSGDTTGLGYTTTQYYGVLMLTGGSTTVSEIRGDVDCNGAVELTDAIMLARAIGSTATLSAQGAINADLDGTVGLNGTDLSILLQYLSGKIGSL